MRLTARADDEVSAYVVVLGRLTMTETSKQTASGGVFLLATLAWCFSHYFLIYLGGGMKRLEMMRLLGLLSSKQVLLLYFEELELELHE